MTEEHKEPDVKIAGTTPDLGRLLMSYMACKTAIHKFFGYVPQEVEIPISDHTGYWWLPDEDGFVCGEGDVKEAIAEGKYYGTEVYQHQHLEKHIYVTETHTMVCVDTATDGHKFAIFDNAKKVIDPELITLIREHA